MIREASPHSSFLSSGCIAPQHLTFALLSLLLPTRVSQTWRGMMAPTAAIRRRAPPPASSRPSAGRGAPAGGVVKRTVVTVTDEGGQSVTVEHQPSAVAAAAGGGGGSGMTSVLSPSPSSKSKDSLNITFVDEYDPARPNDFFGFQSEFKPSDRLMQALPTISLSLSLLHTKAHTHTHTQTQLLYSPCFSLRSSALLMHAVDATKREWVGE